MDEEKLISCPYNIAHQIRKAKMQYHLVKCRKQNTSEEKKICPFDATHHVPAPEFEYHLTTCDKRRIVELQKYHVDKKQETGCLELIDYQHNDIENEENWDEECTVERTYDPNFITSQNKCFRRLHGASAAERKKFKLQERERFSKLEQGLPLEPNNAVPWPLGVTESSSEEKHFPMRLQPKQKPAVVNHIYESNPQLGAGRGLIQFSAANGDSGSSGATRQPRVSPSAALMRGRGRGLALQSVAPGFESTSPGLIMKQPALVGRGRGLCRDFDALSIGSASTDEENTDPAAAKRRLQKKLRQIDCLEKKQQDGARLSEEEEQKVSSKDDLLQKLTNLQVRSHQKKSVLVVDRLKLLNNGNLPRQPREKPEIVERLHGLMTKLTNVKGNSSASESKSKHPKLPISCGLSDATLQLLAAGRGQRKPVPLDFQAILNSRSCSVQKSKENLKQTVIGKKIKE